MRRPWKVIRVLGCLVIILLMTSFLVLQLTPNTAPDSRGFLVDTPHCRILDIDPLDPSITRFIRHPGPVRCYVKPSITYEDGNTLRINRTNVKTFYGDNFHHCVYKPIYRHSDCNFTYGEKVAFSNDVVVTHDNIRVECFGRQGETINVNFHSLIIPRAELDDRCDANLKRHVASNNPKETFNVLMLGVDSVSRLNFMRQMPVTRKYLIDNMEAIELVGYTKVADNTFVNVVPMTTGKFVSELPWDESMKDVPFDKHNFIWKNFSSSGYRTLYAEDAPDLSIFTYLKSGFRQSPADHYNRGWSMAAEEEESLWTEKHHCIGDRLETNVLLKYLEDFITFYKDKPYFGFTFITRMSHDDVNDAGMADTPHVEFFQRVHEKELLNNTVLIYFSDHGVRFGDFRYTFVGKLEERLPFMFFVLPKWFRTKYPDIVKNMKMNSNRLTTPFDIYETLKDILNFNGEVKIANVQNRGISLFSEIPRDRSCDDAAILPHWCMCLQNEQMSLTSSVVKKAAEETVNEINSRLSDFSSICETLKLKEVRTASRLKTTGEGVNVHTNNAKEWLLWLAQFVRRTDSVVVYQLVVVTSPGSGTFEATVIFDETSERYNLPGDISRINKYGNQSACITKNYSLRKYCFCKNIT